MSGHTIILSGERTLLKQEKQTHRFKVFIFSHPQMQVDEVTFATNKQKSCKTEEKLETSPGAVLSADL